MMEQKNHEIMDWFGLKAILKEWQRKNRAHRLIGLLLRRFDSQCLCTQPGHPSRDNSASPDYFPFEECP